ncbi:MAG: LEA type 2 family protein [Gammaproteobacteria bacterium]|nr:LEA type 2 family protein [Gammaproteobacteria bacterium]
MTFLRTFFLASSCLLLTACGGGPVRRVSEPAASIQQLTVRADGSWSVDLRLENFSTVPMRFDNVGLALKVGGESAGTLQGQPRLSVGPESADVATLTLHPSPPARIVLADALATQRSVAYSFEGTLEAAPENGGTRSYRVKRSSALSPVPGLPGVLR